MVDFLLFLLAATGTTLILVRGSIFEPFRNFLAKEVARIHRRRQKKNLPPSFSLIESLSELINCPQCMGFWCGLFCGLFLVTSDTFWVGGNFWGIRFLLNRFLLLFCCGAAGSLSAMIVDLVLLWIFSAKELAARTLETFSAPQSFDAEPTPTFPEELPVAEIDESR